MKTPEEERQTPQAQEVPSPPVSARCKKKMESTKKISVEDKCEEEILPKSVEPERNVPVSTQPANKRKRRLVLPSYSSASEEDEVHPSVVEAEQAQVSAIVKEMKEILNEEVKIPKDDN